MVLQEIGAESSAVGESRHLLHHVRLLLTAAARLLSTRIARSVREARSGTLRSAASQLHRDGDVPLLDCVKFSSHTLHCLDSGVNMNTEISLQ